MSDKSGYIMAGGTMLAAIALGAVMALSGCASYNAAVSAGTAYASGQVTAQVQNLQAIHDAEAKALADGLCWVSYGELVRNGSGNPNFPQAVITACGGPAGYTMIHGANTPLATMSIPTEAVPLSAVAPATK